MNISGLEQLQCISLLYLLCMIYRVNIYSVSFCEKKVCSSQYSYVLIIVSKQEGI